MKVWADLEGRNVLDINNALYNETAEITLFMYAFDDGPVKVWQPLRHPVMPAELTQALADTWHHGTHHWYWMNGRKFDTDILEHQGYPIAPEHQTDVGEKAQGYGYPAGLAKLCRALGMEEDEAKDARGAALIQFFCSPINLINKRNIKKNAPFTWDDVAKAQRIAHARGEVFADPEDWPELWEIFIVYGRSDVSSMRLADSMLPDHNDTPKERKLTALNHRMNKEGLRLDLPYVKRMAHLIPLLKERGHEEVKRHTGGIKATQSKKFKEWMQRRLPGREIAGADKDTIERLVKEGDLPVDVEAALSVCVRTKSSSVAKFGVMAEQAHPHTHRIYHYIGMRKANTTGRYGAIGGIQAHNFPRPKINAWAIEGQIHSVMAGHVPTNLLKHAPSLLRASFIPDEGEIFTNCDLSSIEGRTLCWLADFKDQVDDYANGVNAYFANGPMFGVDYDTMKKYKDSQDTTEYNQYMLGKVSELSMLYMGGVSALVGMGRNYGMNMAQVADSIMRANLMPDNLLREGERCWHFISLTARGRKTIAGTRLSYEQWVTLDAVKRAWRLRHSGITSFWADIQRGILMAWNNPGEQFRIGCNGSVGMMFDNNMFGIELPSGRILTYLGGRVGGMSDARKKSNDEIDKLTDEELLMMDEDAQDDRPVLLYVAYDNNGNPYERPQVAHAGVVCNNINQGTAASVLDECIIRAWDEGWKVRLHIHDQLLTSNRIGDPRFTPTMLERLMSEPIDWAPGLPLAAKGEYLLRFAK